MANIMVMVDSFMQRMMIMKLCLKENGKKVN